MLEFTCFRTTSKEEEQFYKHGIGASVIDAGTSGKDNNHV